MPGTAAVPGGPEGSTACSRHHSSPRGTPRAPLPTLPVPSCVSASQGQHQNAHPLTTLSSPILLLRAVVPFPTNLSPNTSHNFQLTGLALFIPLVFWSLCCPHPMAGAGGPGAELISRLFIFMWLLRNGLEPQKYVIYCTIKCLFPSGLDLGEL